MSSAVFRVNLHCHSTFSDGDLSPEQVASLLAARGVVYAALTDHDNIEGAARFKEEATRRGLGCIAGVEITAEAKDLEVHILVYGADPKSPKLAALLQASRRRNDPRLRTFFSGGGFVRRSLPAAEEVFKAVRDAGGISVLAHPLTTEPDLDRLTVLTRDLKKAGLDGLESFYGPYEKGEREALLGLADAQGLLTSAGSDLHGPERNGEADPFVDMPAERWRIFRDALINRRGPGTPFPGNDPSSIEQPGTVAVKAGAGDRSGAGRKPRAARSSSSRIILPTLAAMALFITSLFVVIIPGFEKVLLDRKLETIRDLTTSVHSLLLQYQADVVKGRVSEEGARHSAVEHLRGLRYGPGGKDYFWVTDRTPVMIVHPYRPDLEGRDVGDFKDAAGDRVFREFLDAVAVEEEGYVEYLWQWQDDAERIAAKLSFVKRFDPWGWVIGTGIYLDDVRAEIRRLERDLRLLALVLTAAVLILLLFAARRGVLAEKARASAETSLKDSYERYRTLSEARTEGLIMTVDGSCTFANETARSLLGYEADEISLLRISDILGPNHAEDRALEGFLETLLTGGAYESVLKKKDGSRARVLLAASPFELGGRRGSILSLRPPGKVRDAADREGLFGVGGEPELSPSLPVGILRLRRGRRIEIISANSAARELLGLRPDTDRQKDFTDSFAEPAELEAIFRRLDAGEESATGLLVLRMNGLSIRIFAAAAHDPAGGEKHIDLAIINAQEEAAARELGRSLAEGFSGVPVFLGRRVSEIARAVPRIPLDAEAGEAADLLENRISDSPGEPGTAHDCLIVTGPGGEAVGLVTAKDILRRRSRGMAETRVYEAMSAPLTRLPGDAPVSEALELMRNPGAAPIVLRDPPGGPGRVVGSADLLGGFKDAMWVIREEIRNAAGIPELRALRRRFSRTAVLALASGQNAPAVLRGLSELSDLLTGVLTDLTVRHLGPPPGRFVFLALGSEGRREHIPGADQDNALVSITASNDPEGRRAAEEYFRRLGEELCRGLETIGLPRCPGGVMASSPAWRGDIDEWKARIRDWAAVPDPKQVLGMSTFLDFRPQGGDPEISEELHRFLDGLVPENPELLQFIARSIVQTALPALPRSGVLRDIIGEGWPDVDIKALMMPIAGYARLLSLRGRVRCTGTLARLSALRDGGAVKEGDYREMKEAYEFLLELRLSRQLGASELIDLGRTFPAGLSQAGEARLRHAAAQASLAQKALGFEFLGSSV
jgi:PAS domain S-box-containing protein